MKARAPNAAFSPPPPTLEGNVEPVMPKGHFVAQGGLGLAPLSPMGSAPTPIIQGGSNTLKRYSQTGDFDLRMKARDKDNQATVGCVGKLLSFFKFKSTEIKPNFNYLNGENVSQMDPLNAGIVQQQAAASANGGTFKKFTKTIGRHLGKNVEKPKYMAPAAPFSKPSLPAGNFMAPQNDLLSEVPDSERKSLGPMAKLGLLQNSQSPHGFFNPPTDNFSETPILRPYQQDESAPPAPAYGDLQPARSVASSVSIAKTPFALGYPLPPAEGQSRFHASPDPPEKKPSLPRKKPSLPPKKSSLPVNAPYAPVKKPSLNSRPPVAGGVPVLPGLPSLKPRKGSYQSQDEMMNVLASSATLSRKTQNGGGFPPPRNQNRPNLNAGATNQTRGKPTGSYTELDMMNLLSSKTPNSRPSPSPSGNAKRNSWMDGSGGSGERGHHRRRKKKRQGS